MTDRINTRVLAWKGPGRPIRVAGTEANHHRAQIARVYGKQLRLAGETPPWERTGERVNPAKEHHRS